MSDLLDRLQEMVDAKHDDKDVAREAIEEIVKLEAQHGEQADQIYRLWAAREALQQEIAAKDALIAKLQDALIAKIEVDLANARREGMEDAANNLLEKYQHIVIRPNTPEAWRFSILQDLREMTGEKPELTTAADIDAAAKEVKP